MPVPKGGEKGYEAKLNLAKQLLSANIDSLFREDINSLFNEKIACAKLYK